MKSLVNVKTFIAFLLMYSLSACASLPSQSLPVSVVEHPQVESHFAQVSSQGAERLLSVDVSAAGSRAKVPSGKIQIEFLSQTGDVLAVQTQAYAGRHQAVHQWYKAGDKVRLKLDSAPEQVSGLRISFITN